MRDPALSFFQSVFADSLELISRLPITLEPPLMAHITGVLQPAVEAAKARSPFQDPDFAADQIAPEGPEAAGLNTVGLLLDRLSILAIKHWNLVHRAQAPAKADALVPTQVADLLRALAGARPGSSSINNKMTSRLVEADAAIFPAAYYGLLTTNLMLWESQEILYNHDIQTLPCEELRAYIDFFSRGNLTRNVYIQGADETYWSSVRARSSAEAGALPEGG